MLVLIHLEKQNIETSQKIVTIQKRKVQEISLFNYQILKIYYKTKN